METKLILLVLLLTLPVWLCVVFWLLPLGSIGPFVLLTWIVNSIVLPIIFYQLGKKLKNKEIRMTALILAIPVGLIIAYFQFISYMALTPIFHLDDFYWL